MKKNKVIFVSLIAGFSTLSFFTFSHKGVYFMAMATDTSSLPTTINLNLVGENDVRSYYSALNGLGEDELKGTNLLKNLKPILKEGAISYTYDSVWKIYEITDRNWNLSPASGVQDGTYDANSNTIANYIYGSENNNPYVHLLYINDNDDIEHAFKILDSHSGTESINREHCWPQSYGFKASSGAKGPAGTDIHHLLAADGQTNSIGHNNYTYGNVTANDSTWQEKVEARPRISGNKRCSASVTYEDHFGESTYIFEPQDSDKGDIARALFYMCARYNNYANETGAISAYEPFLALSDYIYKNGTSISSSDTNPATYGMVSVLLEWNELDPPDEYEIYRNDLIYNNFQHNRNPFIDFPTWANYIWGNESGAVNPMSDPLNAFELDERVLTSISIDTPPTKTTYTEGEIFLIDGVVITAKYEDGTSENVTNKVSYNKIKLTTVGEQDITVSYTHNGVTKTTTIRVTVNAKPKDYQIYVYIGSGVIAGILALVSFLLTQKARQNRNRYSPKSKNSTKKKK